MKRLKTKTPPPTDSAKKSTSSLCYHTVESLVRCRVWKQASKRSSVATSQGQYMTDQDYSPQGAFLTWEAVSHKENLISSWHKAPLTQFCVTSCQATPSKSLSVNPAFSNASPRGQRHSGHDKLRLQVGLDVWFPHRVVEVQVQGALAGHAAVAVAASGFPVGQPLVGSALVPPGLPAQALLLHQQLQALHFAACGAVLVLTHVVTWRREKAMIRVLFLPGAVTLFIRHNIN